jgi:hypothetical protein
MKGKSKVEFQWVITGVAVEKLTRGKRSQIASLQDALQTIFSGRRGIFYPQNHAVFVDIDFFNTHRP